jgi:hypothetical protein
MAPVAQAVEKLLPVTAGDVGFLVRRDRTVREAICRLGKVSLEARGRHDKDATPRRTHCVSVGRPARHEDEGAYRSDEDLVAAANLVLTVEDVECFVAAGVPVEGGADVGRVGHLDERVGCALAVPDFDVHPGAAKENLVPAVRTEKIATSIDHGG